MLMTGVWSASWRALRRLRFPPRCIRLREVQRMRRRGGDVDEPFAVAVEQRCIEGGGCRSNGDQPCGREGGVSVLHRRPFVRSWRPISYPANFFSFYPSDAGIRPAPDRLGHRSDTELQSCCAARPQSPRPAWTLREYRARRTSARRRRSWRSWHPTRRACTDHISH